MSSLLFPLMAVFIGSLVQTLSGFAFALIVVSLFLFTFPTQMAVSLVVLLNAPLTYWLLWQTRKHVQPGQVLWLTLSSLMGVPIGAWLLKTIDPTLLKGGIGWFIVVFGIFLLLGFRIQIQRERLAQCLVGFVSGMMNASVSMPGPPVVIFFNNQGLAAKKETYKANLFFFFTCTNTLSLLLLWQQRLLNGSILTTGLKLLPGLVVGVLLGRMLTPFTNERFIRNSSIFLLLVTGTKAIWSSMA